MRFPTKRWQVCRKNWTMAMVSPIFIVRRIIIKLTLFGKAPLPRPFIKGSPRNIFSFSLRTAVYADYLSRGHGATCLYSATVPPSLQPVEGPGLGPGPGGPLSTSPP